MSLFRRPDFSDWRIAGSAGVDVQVETPVVNLSAGGGYLNLPLENTRTKEKITLHMGGVEVGLGIGDLWLVAVGLSLAGGRLGPTPPQRD